MLYLTFSGLIYAGLKFAVVFFLEFPLWSRFEFRVEGNGAAGGGWICR